MLNDEALGALEAARREYEQKVEEVLSRYGETAPSPCTTSGIPLKATYNPTDLAGFDYLRELGFPGEYPYTRGVTPLAIGPGDGRCGKSWEWAPPRRPTNASST